MNCKICNREVGERDFCLLHFEAYENIVEKHGFWRKALKVTWKEYLSEIKRNPLTGETAKQVANYLTSNEETANGKKS